MIQNLPALERIIRARSALMSPHPFYSCISLHLALEASAQVETAATDGKRLLYRPDYIESLTEPELIGLTVHEIRHITGMHHVRRGGRELKLWNVSCDYAINRELIAEGFTLPKGFLWNPRFDGMTAEQIYAVLHAERSRSQEGQANAAPKPGQQGNRQWQSSSQPGSGQPGTGQGKPDNWQPGQPGSGPAQASINAPDPGMCGGIIDAAPDGPSLDQVAAETEAMVRQAIAIAASAAGEMPGNLKRILAELNEPRIPWREALARFIDDAATRVIDWCKPDKRFLGSEFIFPGRSKDSIRQIAVVVDTSGSINDATLNAFASEIQGILDSGRVESIHVVYCDSRVQGSQEFTLGDKIDLDAKGGRGTRFDVAIEHVMAHAPDAAAIVYLTDLDSSYFGADPGIPVLWAVQGRIRKAPFGEILPIDPFA